jgi:transposase
MEMPGPLLKYTIILTEDQEKEMEHISQSYTLPHWKVQRAQILLLAHRHPNWSNNRIAEEVNASCSTVKHWRRRWASDKTITDLPRSGAPRKFPASVRTQIIALACTKPMEHGKPWQRWSPERLALVAVEKGIVDSISASNIRRWLSEDKVKPWQYHLWQKPTDPMFVEKATPVLDLYEGASELSEQGEAVVCIDEKTSIQARKRIHETRPAVPEHPNQVASRYERMGALQLFCALMVATGTTFAQCFDRKRFIDFQAFLVSLFTHVQSLGIKVLHIILDNAPTHAPKQLIGWIASLDIDLEVHIYWLPKYASWLDQAEIIFSKLQRDLLTPSDFDSKEQLRDRIMDYFAELNRNPRPVKWTYTKAKFLVKFCPDQTNQLVA